MAEIKSGTVAANGINYYYQIHGEGEPLLLLHGGLMHGEMFAPILPALAAARQVIAVDLQGHGHTNLGDREFNLVGQGDDMVVIVKALGYGQVDVMGYSMGGGVALRFAIQHPEMVRRLVLVSTPYAQQGFYPEMLPQQAMVGSGMMEYMKDTPMYLSYVAVAPNPDEFPKLLDQIGGFMRKDYNFAEDVKTLKMPVMLVYGDSDMITLDHAVSFYKLLGGGQKDAGWQREHMATNRLAIVPDLTHYDMFDTARLADVVLPFLNGHMQGLNG